MAKASRPTRSRQSSVVLASDALWPFVFPGIVVALLWLAPCSAAAQDTELPPLADVSTPCAPEVAPPRNLVLEHEGTQGIWFQLEIARCMVGRLAMLPLYAQRVNLLEQRLQLSNERHQLMQRQVRLAEEGEEQAVGALEASVRRTREAEESRDAWWRSPILWVIVGAVIVAGLEALAIWGFSQIPVSI